MWLTTLAIRLSLSISLSVGVCWFPGRLRRREDQPHWHRADPCPGRRGSGGAGVPVGLGVGVPSLRLSRQGSHQRGATVLLHRRGALPQGDERTSARRPFPSSGCQPLKGGPVSSGKVPRSGGRRALGSDRDVPAPPRAHRGPAFLWPAQAKRDCHLLGPGLSCSRQAGGSKGRVGVGYPVVACFSGRPGASLVDGWAGGKHMA